MQSNARRIHVSAISLATSGDWSFPLGASFYSSGASTSVSLTVPGPSNRHAACDAAESGAVPAQRGGGAPGVPPLAAPGCPAVRRLPHRRGVRHLHLQVRLRTCCTGANVHGSANDCHASNSCPLKRQMCASSKLTFLSHSQMRITQGPLTGDVKTHTHTVSVMSDVEAVCAETLRPETDMSSGTS